jgi:hypothetical protein
VEDTTEELAATDEAAVTSAAEQGPAADGDAAELTLAQQLTAFLEQVRDQRKRVAIRVARLKSRNVICSSGASSFYSNHGIPFDGYYVTVSDVESWDGNLRTGFPWDISSLGFVDLACYSDLGIQRLLEAAQQKHQEWLDSVRSNALQASRNGNLTVKTIQDALKFAGIEAPQVMTTVEVRLKWRLPPGQKLTTAKTTVLEGSIKAALMTVTNGVEPTIINLSHSERVE